MRAYLIRSMYKNNSHLYKEWLRKTSTEFELILTRKSLMKSTAKRKNNILIMLIMFLDVCSKTVHFTVESIFNFTLCQFSQIILETTLREVYKFKLILNKWLLFLSRTDFLRYKRRNQILCLGIRIS